MTDYLIRTGASCSVVTQVWPVSHASGMHAVHILDDALLSASLSYSCMWLCYAAEKYTIICKQCKGCMQQLLLGYI